MNRVLQGFAITVLILSIGSCSRHQTLYSSSTKNHSANKNSRQNSGMTSTNWHKVASSLADAINNTLIQKDYGNRSVYLDINNEEATDFDRSFHKILTASLLNKGVPVAEKPGLNTLTISCESLLLLTSKTGYWSNSRQGTLLLTASIIFEKRYIFSQSQLFELRDDELTYFIPPTTAQTIAVGHKESATPAPHEEHKIIIQKVTKEMLPTNPKPIL